MATSASATPTPAENAPREQDEYVLGTSDLEIDRLGLQHRIWSAWAHRLWERAAIQPGMTVLDVGCGPGHATMDLAELVGPSGHILAVDESALYLKTLNDRLQGRRLNNVERILGDVQDLEHILPHARGTVDIAWARWVLCFVARPQDVVRGIAQLLKPGGRVVIQDYFNYETFTLAPRSEAITRIVRAVASSWRARGGDPDIVGRLPRMLREEGFTITHMDVDQRLARPGSTAWHWPDTFWRSFVPRLVAMGHITAADAAAFNAEWARAGSDPDVFMMLPPVFEVIATRS